MIKQVPVAPVMEHIHCDSCGEELSWKREEFGMFYPGATMVGDTMFGISGPPVPTVSHYYQCQNPSCPGDSLVVSSIKYPRIEWVDKSNEHA